MGGQMVLVDDLEATPHQLGPESLPLPGRIDTD